MNHIEKAQQLFAKGCEFKRKGLIKDAISEFSRTIIMIHLVYKTENFDREKELMFVKEIQIPCFLKLCSCYLKAHEEISKVVVLCSDVLEIDSTNAKAYFLRAQASNLTHHFDKALKDIAKARENQPDNLKFRDFQVNARKKKKETELKPRISFSALTLIGKTLLSLCKHRRLPIT